MTCHRFLHLIPSRTPQLLAILLLLATGTLNAAGYDAGNYRRDADEANRQRAAEQSRRASESANRRNEEMRNNAYKPSSSSGGYSSTGSSSSSGSYPGTVPSSSQPSGPQAIESTTTVTVRVQETPEQTVARLQREAAAGKVESQWNLGRLYNTGGLGGVAQDEAKAAKWFRSAAEAGHAEAALAYGEMLFNGKGVTANTPEAGKWFRIAAEKGIPKAMYLWGLMLEVGHGTQQDTQAAFGWYKKAAEGGETRAYANLGECFEEGRGVTANAAEAAKWYRKGADSGDGAASISLGGLYYAGKGVPQDQVEAGRWFIKGAEAGNKNGMFNAGLMYEQGILGVSRDIAKARYWFGKAAAAGVKEADAALQRVSAADQPKDAHGRPEIAGRYVANGKNPSGSIYRGEVTIKQDADGYYFFWKIGDIRYQGHGDHAAGKFTIDWGDAYPVIYRLAGDGSLIGTWNNGNATEELVPVR